MTGGLQNVLNNPYSTEEDMVNKVRSIQTHEINAGRPVFGEYHHLFNILKRYLDKFLKYMRMSVAKFQYLLEEIKPRLSKNWCNLHPSAIKEEEQLVITIR